MTGDGRLNADTNPHGPKLIVLKTVGGGPLSLIFVRSVRVVHPFDAKRTSVVAEPAQ
jgi:hypothetical protein